MFLVRELGLVVVLRLVAGEVDVLDAELQMLSNLGIKLSTDQGEPWHQATASCKPRLSTVIIQLSQVHCKELYR